LWGPNTEQETKEYIRAVLAWRLDDPRKNILLGIVRKDSGDLIGSAGLFRSDGDATEAEVGYSLQTDHWGNGYATEAARAMIDFGFREWHLHRVHARCDPENLGSVRVLEKCGMRREGHFRKVAMVKGEWRDRLIYAVLEEEWTA
jgi:RimJ/RimL family protein N-acetyltransferase